jgi:outer membrane protein TolC
LLAAGLTGCAITPTPLTTQERASTAQSDRDAMFAHQEPLSGPVTLEEAMARAIRYNLDQRVKLMEQALAQRQLDIAGIDLLPKLALSAGYTSRDNVLASSSRDISTGKQSLVPSTSTEKSVGTADLGLTWNVLDFGVSYYDARQQADRTLVAEERRRKVVHLLMEQTRQAYWQAAGAQMLQGRVDPVLAQARQALADARKVEAEKLRSPLESLNYQRQLLDIVRQLEAVRDELAQAKPRLASLMNLSPGTPFEVVVPGAMPVPGISLPMAAMEETALVRRPELVEAQYNERIGVLETRKALARLLPGLEISLGGHYDSNSYLVNQQWADAGLRVSWNLLNVFQADTLRGAAQAQVDLARQQRLALDMAVLTQVHVADLGYKSQRRQFDLVRQMNDVDQRILTYTQAATASDAQGQLEEIRAAAAAMMSELRLYQSYGALQGAYGQVIATQGLDPLPASVPAEDIGTLSKAVGQSEAAWVKTVDPGAGS